VRFPYGIYQRDYVDSMKSELKRLREQNTSLINATFTMNGMPAPLMLPQPDIEGSMLPIGRPSWKLVQSALEREAAK